MRVLAVILAIFMLGLGTARPAAAQMEMCDHTPTVAALRHCVMHAAEMGHITSAGVAQSLFAKLDGAQAALDRGQPAVAVNKLRAFIQEVRAQAGRHIEAQHAAHMIMHAEHVIAALQP
jgi:hypothetical protein